MNLEKSFYELTPNIVMEASEEAGFAPTGEFTQLNSYENRVFDIRNENNDNKRVIAKFYRPGRWSEQSLLEEHDFLQDLKKEGVPVIAPLTLKNKKTLLSFAGMHVAFFPKYFGRMPDELQPQDLFQIGRRLAQIHNVGTQKKFHHRGHLTQTPFSCWDHLDELEPLLAPEVRERYLSAAEEIFAALEDEIDSESFIRIHGDCHRGNLLMNPLPQGQKEYFFVDFDDCIMGPEVQDIWMLFAEEDDPEEQELIISGYEELREFPRHQLSLVPLLRGYRIIHYAAWIARRWKDPSFPSLFPNFSSYSYWAEESEALEKIAWRRPLAVK